MARKRKSFKLVASRETYFWCFPLMPLTTAGMYLLGKQISLDDKRGRRPNTKLKGDKPSKLAEGVTFMLK